jgi:hypothetical protein
LTTVTDKPSPGGAATKVVSYEYDAFDRRISRTVDNTPIGSDEKPAASARRRLTG